MKKVCVAGLGYIGLPTAIILADNGFEVTGFDIDVQKVQRINQGDPVIQEPELSEKLKMVLASKQLQAVISMPPADYFIIAVPTPVYKDKRADLSHVFSVVEHILSVIKKGDVIIIESTVPVGTTKKIAVLLEERTGFTVGKEIAIAYCPERVLPGKIFKELVENSRIIGGITQESVAMVKSLYEQFVTGDLHITDATTAEMVKLVENSSRDVEIAFAHQVAEMAAAARVSPYEVIELANKHPRVHIKQPTAGVGGHCIAIDPWFLIEGFEQQTSLLQEARLVNDQRPVRILENIQQAICTWTQEQSNSSCTVLLLGATYKPNVDDVRESPALMIARDLISAFTGTVMVCEPHVDKQILYAHIGDRSVAVAEGLARADIVVCLVAHDYFKTIEPKALINKKILDFCGLFHKKGATVAEHEHLFWPARSILDIFISNQGSFCKERDL